MKIERGIIEYNNRNEMIVSSPGHIYHLNNESFYSRSLKKSDKVLGVIVDNRFSVCREFISDTGHFVFGFIKNEPSPGKQLTIQTIPGLVPKTFNPFAAEYSMGAIAIADLN